MNTTLRPVATLLMSTLATFVVMCLVFAAISRAAVRPWATPVHNLMIETAFPEASLLCLAQLQAGSRYADSARFQSGEYSYMHAMRSGDQAPDEAARLMWRYIEAKYAEARLLARDGRDEDACNLRGQALHPIMDSTSPAHRGFRSWEPIALKDLFRPGVLATKLAEMAQHGDFQKYVEHVASLPFNLSDEDMNVIDNHPEYLEASAAIMRTVDTIEMLE